MDYYAILGVHPTAEDVVIRAAYKALAQRYHPDRFAGSQEEAHRRMSELAKAYEVLADPARRQKYDRRRLTYTQSVATYFNGSGKFPPPMLDPQALSAAAAKRRRSRIALSALMAAVVVLSVFNLFQYSPQIKGWLSAGLPDSSTAADGSARRGTEASVGTAYGDAARSPSAGRTATAPVGTSGATSGQAAPVDAQTPPARQPEASATQTQLPVGPGDGAPRAPDAEVMRTAVVPNAPLPVAASSASAQAAASPAAAAPAATSGPATSPSTPLPAVGAASTVAGAGPSAASPSAERRAGGAAPPGRATTVERPITLPAAAPAPDACGDAVAALGLCSPTTTARNK